jgi:hypothetical protein
MPSKQPFTVKKKLIERVRITGPMENIHAAYEWAGKRGYRITFSGPRVLAKDFPKIDPTRFQMTGEREA